MENLTEDQKKAHALAERADKPSADVFKMINYLRLMGDRLPIGTRFTGETVQGMVNICEKRGVEIPGRPLNTIDTAELRSLQTKFDAATKDLPTSKPTTKSQTTRKQQYTDLELDALIEKQIADFEKLCMKSDPQLTVTQSRPVVRAVKVKAPAKHNKKQQYRL